MKRIVFFLCVLCAHLVQGQDIFSNELIGSVNQALNPYTEFQVVDINITVSGIGRGSGISATANTNDRYNAKGWDSPMFDSNDYFYFTLTPNTGYEIDFISFVYTGQTSGAGPVNFAFRSSVDNYSSDLGLPTANGTTIDLSGLNYQNVTNSITFRIYAWGANSVQGTFSINDFVFNGIVTPAQCPSTASVWDGSSWDPSVPTSASVAVLNGSYDTFIHGSFSACRLTVNSGTLTISNGDFIEVANDLINNANIIVRTQGSFVQINDAATIAGSGTITVEKETAPANKWYEYTYWSSPVVNAAVSNALSDAQPDRIFSYKAQNYLDALMEIDNTNTYMTGQDDIDDNGNDWQRALGSDLMIPGIGYASTHNRLIFESSPGSPKRFLYTFNGNFNNGEITVPLYRNDSELSDTNFNFIGNPYPSAISVDQFLSTNTDLEGIIYLWSQNTLPSITAKGNEVLNFSDVDYAIINTTGAKAGGDGIVPNRYIPSCQGFFVSYSDSATPISIMGDISEGSVTFNNAMRVKGGSDNSQFFKRANTKAKPHVDNKLWVNLTSDSGVFNQILVGYVEGATKYDDGSSYDAHKQVGPNASASLYTLIENSNKKYVIQGKSVQELKLGEKIDLGFITNIPTSTTYKLSIEKIQGQFFEENDVFLFDKQQRKHHNLSDSPYLFTSVIGEFNDRFQIRFRPINIVVLNSTFIGISTLGNNDFKFATHNDSVINSVTIYDLLGNRIYDLKGKNSTETFNLPKIRTSSIYIAKIVLDDGFIITKKFINN